MTKNYHSSHLSTNNNPSITPSEPTGSAPYKLADSPAFSAPNIAHSTTDFNQSSGYPYLKNVQLCKQMYDKYFNREYTYLYKLTGL